MGGIKGIMEKQILNLNKSMNKYSNLLIISLLILSIIGLYIVSTEEINKYFKSMGYLIICFTVLGITFLKKKQFKERS